MTTKQYLDELSSLNDMVLSLEGAASYELNHNPDRFGAALSEYRRLKALASTVRSHRGRFVHWYRTSRVGEPPVITGVKP